MIAMEPLTFKKKLVFSFLLFIATLSVCEIISFTLYLALNGKIFPLGEYQLDIRRASRTNASDREKAQWNRRGMYVVHPYLGYVETPAVENPPPNVVVPNFGFVDNPIFSRTNDDLIVAIFGGSFASQTAIQAKPSLIKALQPLRRKVTVLNLAEGGYKQPQQLFALSYLLALGAQFDIVINLDGFNEVVLPPAENIPKKVFPIYPRGWYFIVNELNDPVIVKMLARLEALDEGKQSWAKFFMRGFLNKSATSCLVWKAGDQLYGKKINELLLALNDYKLQDPSSYVRNGPGYSFKTEFELYDDLASYWKRCSLQMKSICEAENIRYYHFFQPNQYDPGSKSMSKEEQQVAIYDDHVYKPSVLLGYPALRQHGTELRKRGVDFHDLSMIFADVEEPLYTDTCCHLNQRGYEIIATRIGKTIVDGFDQSQSSLIGRR
jgi:hypothetical protein